MHSKKNQNFIKMKTHDSSTHNITSPCMCWFISSGGMNEPALFNSWHIRSNNWNRLSADCDFNDRDRCQWVRPIVAIINEWKYIIVATNKLDKKGLWWEAFYTYVCTPNQSKKLIMVAKCYPNIAYEMNVGWHMTIRIRISLSHLKENKVMNECIPKNTLSRVAIKRDISLY